MANIIARGLNAPPEIIETYGVPEFFCDLALIIPHGEIARIMLCSERHLGSPTVDLVARLIMPMSGFIRSKAYERSAELKAALNSLQ